MRSPLDTAPPTPAERRAAALARVFVRLADALAEQEAGGHGASPQADKPPARPESLPSTEKRT